MLEGLGPDPSNGPALTIEITPIVIDGFVRIAAINKWLRPRVPEGCVIHSFRHSLRDRLRAVECPSDMIDQIGGWATAGVGQAYGDGYGIDKKWEWLSAIT